MVLFWYVALLRGVSKTMVKSVDGNQEVVVMKSVLREYRSVMTLLKQKPWYTPE